jgi:hypothetical protein
VKRLARLRTYLTLWLLTLLVASAGVSQPIEIASTPTQQSEFCHSGTYSYAHVNAPCVWDSRHRGDRDAGRQGSRSFVVSRSLDFYYIRHVRAHCMLRPHAPGACPGGKR